jgi:predicted NUDIX family NTP pyrophosphohydrolase
MAKQSAGILLYRRINGLEVMLVHPGGPFFAKKDLGSWTIPKGEIAENEDPFSAALREFREETGAVLKGPGIALPPVRQKGGKIVYAWAIEGDLDASLIVSNTFTWPAGSAREFPEVDRAQWFTPDEALKKINDAQRALIDALAGLVHAP